MEIIENRALSVPQIPRIQQLAPGVSEKIAAGEVVERPASVIKELVENALDAGATEIQVVLEEGGKRFLEVTDNGHGIWPEDLALALQRHATSKVSQFSDLEKLATLGFRGEALPSIAAVSEMSILTRSRFKLDASKSDAYLLEARNFPESSSGKVVRETFGHFLGSDHGTRVQVRSLFSQVPARLKFLKSQGAEVAQVRDWIERLALTRPDAGFTLISEGKRILHYRPESELDRVKAVLLDGEDHPCLKEEINYGDHLKLRLYWLQGASFPQTKKLVQIVNHRAVKDRMLQQALLQPFRQALLPGQFPGLALFVEIDPSQIDVNVHPTKTEVRFLDSSLLFRKTAEMGDKLIQRAGAPRYVSNPFSGAAGAHTGAFFRPNSTPYVQNFQNTHFQPELSPSAAQSSVQAATPPSGEWVLGQPLNDSDRATPFFTHDFHPERYLGILFNTYLAYNLGNEMGLIDQHAAHERVRYEKLRKAWIDNKESPASQSLLLPEVVSFQSEERGIIETQFPFLTRLGFEPEFFGETELLIRSVPSAWGKSNLKIRLKNLVERLKEMPEGSLNSDPSGKALGVDENLFESLASEACHSAIRAGDALTAFEAKALVEDLFACEHPWNCPHGRPTVVRVPEARFEEWFQRRV